METKTRTLIKKEWLKQKGFLRKRDAYRLRIKIIPKEKNLFIFSYYDKWKGWGACYVVNGNIASKLFYSVEEIERLLNALS